MDDVIIEFDAQVVTTRLTKSTLFFSDSNSILSDVLFMCQYFHSISFNHVKRYENYVVRSIILQELCLLESNNVESVIIYPGKVAPYVLMDTLCLA